MTIYYSNTSKAFFDTDLGYPTLPDDIIEITAEEHKVFLHAMNNENKELTVDSKGKLKLVDKAVAVTWDLIRFRRNRLLKDSDYTQMADWPGDKEAWSVYRQALRDIPEVFDSPHDVIWPTAPGE